MQTNLVVKYSPDVARVGQTFQVILNSNLRPEPGVELEVGRDEHYEGTERVMPLAGDEAVQHTNGDYVFNLHFTSEEVASTIVSVRFFLFYDDEQVDDISVDIEVRR